MSTRIDASADGRGHSDAEWLIPMAVIAGLQFSAWYGMWNAGFARRPLIGLYDKIAIAGLVMGFVPFFLSYLWKIHRAGEDHPIRRIRHDVELPRVVAVGIALLLGPITAGSFSALKGAIPVAVPFYLDPALARLDRVVFGTDPWRLTHQVLGWATPLIDRFYLSWLLVMLVSFYLVLLSKPSATKTQSLIAYLLMWPLVGTVGGYALSSAGPLFQDALFGGHSGLLPALEHEGATKALFLQGELLAAYRARYDMLGTGISAMPSMHIAMAGWFALTLRTAWPKFQWIGWTYVLLIWIASVHLGWHYASDGFVGIVGALLIWRLAGALGSRLSSWLNCDLLIALKLRLGEPWGRLARSRPS